MHDGCIKYKTSVLTTETAGKIQNKTICITIVTGNYKRLPITSKRNGFKVTVHIVSCNRRILSATIMVL